jgi:hypothetical protein
LAAAGSATAASALAVIMFPVEALGAFNISIFGLHGRRPGRCPVAPIPPPSPPAACVCSSLQALSNTVFGKGATSKRVVSPVRPIKSMQVRCKAAFCLYPSFLYTQLRRIDHVRITEHFQTPTGTNYSHSFTCVWILNPHSIVLLEALASDIF